MAGKDKPIQSKNLIIFRKSKNWTQKELADILGTDQSRVSKYERGDLFIPPEDVKILHIKHGLSYEWFYNSQGKPEKKEEKGSNLIKDIGTLRTLVDQLDQRVKKLESENIKLVRDLYALKHNVAAD